MKVSFWGPLLPSLGLSVTLLLVSGFPGRCPANAQAGLPAPQSPSARGSFPVGEKMGLKVVSAFCRTPVLGLISEAH